MLCTTTAVLLKTRIAVRRRSLKHRCISRASLKLDLRVGLCSRRQGWKHDYRDGPSRGFAPDVVECRGESRSWVTLAYRSNVKLRARSVALADPQLQHARDRST